MKKIIKLTISSLMLLGLMLLFSPAFSQNGDPPPPPELGATRLYQSKRR